MRCALAHRWFTHLLEFYGVQLYTLSFYLGQMKSNLVSPSQGKGPGNEFG